MAAGRHTKLDRDLLAQITRYLQEGNYRSTVCDIVGICPQTFCEWMAAGEATPGKRYTGPPPVDKDGNPVGKGTFGEFAEAVKRAEAAAQARCLRIIMETAPGTWQAAAWYLERKFPELFGQRGKVEHSTPPGKPLEVTDPRQAPADGAMDLSRLSEAELLLLQGLYAKCQSDTPTDPA